MNLLENKKGVSLVNALIALSLLSVVIWVHMSLTKDLLEQQKRNEVHTTLGNLRRGLLAEISNSESWLETRARNSVMDCMKTHPPTCTEQPEIEFDLYRSDKSVLIETSNPQSGFSYSGEPCTTFQLKDDKCPFKAKAFWSIECDTGSGCQFPTEKISLRFISKDSQRWPVSKYNLISFNRKRNTLSDSPTAQCAAIGDFIFVGHNQTLTTPKGDVINSDSNGCIAIAAFNGATGDAIPGPQGPSTSRPLTLAEEPCAPTSGFGWSGGGCTYAVWNTSTCSWEVVQSAGCY